MSFEEDFSSQYLPVLALRLKCSQQSKYLCRKPSGCLQQHLVMNACYCRSLRYTKHQLPFSKIQRYAESKLPKHSVIMCSWQALRSVYSTGCSWAALEHSRSTRSVFEGSPGAVRALRCSEGAEGSGAWRRRSCPHTLLQGAWICTSVTRNRI